MIHKTLMAAAAPACACAASATGELVWQFTQPGEFQFAGLVPGHYEAGMIGKVVVK